jgi:hypothetical protein
MAGRRSTASSYQSHYQQAAGTPGQSVRNTQPTHQMIPPLNASIQAQYQSLNYRDIGQTSYAQVAGVSSPFSAPMVAPGTQFRSNAQSNPSIVDYILAAIGPVLAAHQETSSARIEQIGTAIENLGLTVGGLVKQLTNVRKDTEDQKKEAADALEKAHDMQLSTSRVLAARLMKLEKLIETSNGRDEKKSLLNRLDTISYAVGELLERARDPDAPCEYPNLSFEPATKLDTLLPVSDVGAELPIDDDGGIDLRTPEPSAPLHTYADTAIDSQTPEPTALPAERHDVGTSPVPQQYRDTHVDSRTPEPMPPPLVRREVGTDTTYRVYANEGTTSRTPEPAQPPPVHCETGASPARQIYVDAAIHTRTPEPLPPLHARHEIGTSPVRQLYIDVSIGPRTPSPVVQGAFSVGTFQALDFSQASISNARRFSSGALTLGEWVIRLLGSRLTDVFSCCSWRCYRS